MAEPTTPFHRETAHKILLRQLLDGKIAQDEGTTSLLLPSLEKVSRVNVMATVLAKEKVGNITNFMVDDGTGQAVLRFFEQLPLMEQIQIGNTLLIVGKPRIYNQEVYLSPEIVKKVLPVWLHLRKKELEQEEKEFPSRLPLEMVRPHQQKEENTVRVEQVVDDISVPAEKIMRLIKELDQGRGVLVEELIEKSPIEETEQLLEKLLEKGEIFQNMPGKVKLL